jgi:glutamate synthase domain-containing protein 1
MGFFASNLPERSLTPNLLDSRFDHDSCGVGFVATLRNQPTHEILTQALTALARLAHRGAIAADGKSSDGVGIMTAIPREFLLASTGLSLDAGKPLAGQRALERLWPRKTSTCSPGESSPPGKRFWARSRCPVSP